jgi:hypothetical protein
VFTPVLAKHSKSFSLIDCISVGVDRMQQNFGPIQKQVETWQKSARAVPKQIKPRDPAVLQVERGVGLQWLAFEME